MLSSPVHQNMNLLPLFIAYSLLLKQSVSSTFDYHDVSNWKEEFEFCSAADESPININDTNLIDDNTICDGTFDWSIDRTKQTWQVINNGHSLVLKPVEIYSVEGLTENQIMGRRRILKVEELKESKLKELDLNHNTIAKFPNYFADSTSTTKHYCLDSIHFHWGNTDNYGSEHTINEQRYPIEAHFVHYSCNYNDLGSAMKKYKNMEEVNTAKSKGEDVYVLGVVSVMYEIEDIAGLGTSFTQLVSEELFEKVKFAHEETDLAVVIRNFSLGIDNLIPVMNEIEGYYSYKGSLTTPPCTDIVRWFVIKDKGKIRQSELELFRTLANEDESGIAPNYRDIQVNLNTVYKCDSEWSDDENDSDDELFEENLETLKKIGIYVAVLGTVFVIAMCVGLYFCIRGNRSNNGMQRVRNDESD